VIRGRVTTAQVARERTRRKPRLRHARPSRQACRRRSVPRGRVRASVERVPSSRRSLDGSRRGSGRRGEETPLCPETRAQRPAIPHRAAGSVQDASDSETRSCQRKSLTERRMTRTLTPKHEAAMAAGRRRKGDSVKANERDVCVSSALKPVKLEPGTPAAVRGVRYPDIDAMCRASEVLRPRGAKR
jgi:hypothetical protein